MKAICNTGCEKEFEAELQTVSFEGLSAENLPDRIEKVYFTCTECGKEYLCFYTDTETRRLRESLSNNSFRYGRMNGKTELFKTHSDKIKNRMKKLKERYGV